MHEKRVHEGKLPHISAIEEKQIIERTVKVFTRNCKAYHKIKEREFEREILNPLRIRRDDRLDSKEIDKVFGLTDHTKKIGGKYISIIKQEKKLADKKRFEEAKTARVERIAEKTQKPSRIETIQQEIKGKESKALPKISNNKTSSEASAQGMPNNRSSESDINEKEVKGFKTQLKSGGKSRSWTAAPTSSISYNFSGIGSKLKTPQESDSEKLQESASEKLYKALRSKTSKETADKKPQLEKHDWRMAAYEEETADSPESQSMPESTGMQNKDIDN